LHELLEQGEIDMTLFFRSLAEFDGDAPDLAVFDAAFYDPAKRVAIEASLRDWLVGYAARVRSEEAATAVRRSRMEAANPLYVLRNYLAQLAIDRAEQGDYDGVHELLDVMRRPYDAQPGRERFAAPRPDWARSRPGCSMLSCSS